MPKQSRLLYLLLAICATPLAAHAGPAYNVALVGNLGGTASLGLGINNAGQVVGYAYTPGNRINAFISNGGTATNLHPANDANASDSSAAGINAAGTAVGEVSYKNGTTRAVTFANGAVQVLGTLGGASSFGYGINAGGQVAGQASLADNSYHAFVTQGGGLVDLGTLGGTNSAASGINDLGAVTGYTEIDAAGDYQAFVYANGVMMGLGTLGGNYSQGYAINNTGAVVGYAFLSGDMVSHAFLYANGLMLDLGGFGGNDSYATDINESGQVVGSANDANGGHHAFLYSGGNLQNLDDLIDASLGWSFNYAGGINDAGQIVAHACKAGNQCADLLLTRADGVDGGGDNPVPEPEAFSAGVAALGLLGLLRRRRGRK